MTDRHDIQLHHYSRTNSWYVNGVRAFGANSVDHAKRIASAAGLVTSHAVLTGKEHLVIVDFRPRQLCQYRFTSRIVDSGEHGRKLQWYWLREDMEPGTEHIDREWHVLGAK